MDIFTILLALSFLMLVAYRGYSVILFAPVAAVLAVALTDPRLVPPFSRPWRSSSSLASITRLGEKEEL